MIYVLEPMRRMASDRAAAIAILFGLIGTARRTALRGLVKGELVRAEQNQFIAAVAVDIGREGLIVSVEAGAGPKSALR